MICDLDGEKKKRMGHEKNSERGMTSQPKQHQHARCIGSGADDMLLVKKTGVCNSIEDTLHEQPHECTKERSQEDQCSVLPQKNLPQ